MIKNETHVRPPLVRPPKVRRRRYAVVLTVAVFACLGGLPAILSALHIRVSTALPTSSNGIRLLNAPKALPPVALPPVARPVMPALPPATFPQVNETQEANAVTAEDNRLRTMLHDSYRTYVPTLIDYSGALPTLLLTPGSHYVYSGGDGGYNYLVQGQSVFTAADLIGYGALVMLPDGGALLRDNVFVAAGATLNLSSSDVSSIYLDDTPRGFASIVAWHSTLAFSGTKRNPLTIEGWDGASMTPAVNTGNGRPYIRAVASQMTFQNARVSGLGFWSGRTGGVAWTGLSTGASSGGATSTTFTDNAYGAFVSRGQGVQFTDDLFESNQLDGLHIHRYSVGVTVTYSAAVRNGTNGFHVDRAAVGTVLQNDVSEHNGTNGFLVDGRPLVSTASPSGSETMASTGTKIENSEALDNDRTGILVEGGYGTVLQANEVCAKLTAIAVRLGATNATVDSNDVRCGPRTGLSVGPDAPGTLLYGNAVSGARIAMVVTNAGGTVDVDKSLITMAHIFGISVRGANSAVAGKDNVVSGIGYRAVDSSSDALVPHFSGTDTANWEIARASNVLSYLKFHPLAMLWLSVTFLVVFCALAARLRRAPTHPYPESTRWRGPDAVDEPMPVPIGSYALASAIPAQGGPAPLPAPRPGHAWPADRHQHGEWGPASTRPRPSVRGYSPAHRRHGHTVSGTAQLDGDHTEPR